MVDYTLLTNYPHAVPLTLKGVDLAVPLHPFDIDSGYRLNPDAWVGSDVDLGLTFKVLTICSICKCQVVAHSRNPQKCSQQCIDTLRKIQYKRSNDKRAKVTRITVSCAQCNTPFTPARSDARYCGSRCRVTAHRSQQLA